MLANKRKSSESKKVSGDLYGALNKVRVYSHFFSQHGVGNYERHQQAVHELLCIFDPKPSNAMVALTSRALLGLSDNIIKNSPNHELDTDLFVNEGKELIKDVIGLETVNDEEYRLALDLNIELFRTKLLCYSELSSAVHDAVQDVSAIRTSFSPLLMGSRDEGEIKAILFKCCDQSVLSLMNDIDMDGLSSRDKIILSQSALQSFTGVVTSVIRAESDRISHNVKAAWHGDTATRDQIKSSLNEIDERDVDHPFPLQLAVDYQLTELINDLTLIFEWQINDRDKVNHELEPE